MARRYLLSIDGGGIRGIIPAVALTKLESTTERPARETFSLVAGTSTGAIIAAAIAAGIPAARIVDLYVDRAREVFTGVTLLNTLQRIFTGSMYSTQKLHDVIAEELGPEARDWILNKSPIDLLITAKGVPDGKAWYFVKDSPNNFSCTGSLGLADCVTGSAAAPTYFEPWTIDEPPSSPSDCESVGAMVDGGVGVAGNPVYQACVEAFFYTDENGYKPGRRRPFRWARGVPSYLSNGRRGSGHGSTGPWANCSNRRGSSRQRSPGRTSSRSNRKIRR